MWYERKKFDILYRPLASHLALLKQFSLKFIFSFAVLEVRFNPASYQVSEGDSVQLIVELSMRADRPVIVRYNTQDGTAEGMYYT